MVYLSLGRNGSDFLLPLLASYLLPFLIFAAGGAAIADRMPKRGAIILGKTVEVAALIFAGTAVYHNNPDLIRCSIFFVGMTSALLLPSYSGILHETFSEKYLSKAVGDSLFSGVIASICGILITFLCGRNLLENCESAKWAAETLSVSIPLCAVSLLVLVEVL